MRGKEDGVDQARPFVELESHELLGASIAKLFSIEPVEEVLPLQRIREGDAFPPIGASEKLVEVGRKLRSVSEPADEIVHE